MGALTGLVDPRVVGQLDDQQLPTLGAAPHRVDPADGGALQPHGHQRLAQLGVAVVLEGDAVLLLQPPAPPHARRGRPGLQGFGAQQPPAGGQRRAQRQHRPASAPGHRGPSAARASLSRRPLLSARPGSEPAGAAGGRRFRSSSWRLTFPGGLSVRPRARAAQRRGAQRRGGLHYPPPSRGRRRRNHCRRGRPPTDADPRPPAGSAAQNHVRSQMAPGRTQVDDS